MKTATDFTEKIYVLIENEIEEMTYGDYCYDYGGDETTTPNGVAPRLHLRYDGRFGYNEDAKVFELWTWGVSGNNPLMLKSFDNEQDALQTLYQHFEANVNRNDNAPPFFATKNEAIETLMERMVEINKS